MAALPLTANALESGLYRLVVPRGPHTASEGILDIRIVETNGRAESFEFNIMPAWGPKKEKKEPPLRGILSEGRFIFSIPIVYKGKTADELYVGQDKLINGFYKGTLPGKDPKTGKKIAGFFTLTPVKDAR